MIRHTYGKFSLFRALLCARIEDDLVQGRHPPPIEKSVDAVRQVRRRQRLVLLDDKIQRRGDLSRDGRIPNDNVLRDDSGVEEAHDACLDGVGLRGNLDGAAELDGCAGLVKSLALELLLILVAGHALPVHGDFRILGQEGVKRGVERGLGGGFDD